MNLYNVVIIDDVLIDVLTLKKIVSNYCLNIHVVIHVLSIDEGIAEINKNKPDIVFLDVVFQDSIIFDSLDKLDLEDVSIIFVSSKKEYALNAFEKNAVDFILKPFKVEAVILAINKAIRKIQMNDYLGYTDRSKKNNTKNEFDYLAIASSDKIDFVNIGDVVFCMSDGKYTTFFLLSGKKIVSSKNLGEYEKILNSSFFYRIHNSYIINIKYLVSIIKRDGVYCELINKVTIPISKRRQESFNKFIKLKN
jgi:two-component system, LytTR family, response regulator